MKDTYILFIIYEITIIRLYSQLSIPQTPISQSTSNVTEYSLELFPINFYMFISTPVISN